MALIAAVIACGSGAFGPDHRWFQPPREEGTLARVLLPLLPWLFAAMGIAAPLVMYFR